MCVVFNFIQQEEANQKRKQNRQKEMNKKRNLESLQKDAEKRGKEFEKKVLSTTCTSLRY